jgi:molecular chaperone DnaJ
MSKDYYKVLEISKNAGKEEIKKSFRRLAQKYHPDKKTGDEKKFKEISEAYSVLSDEKKKAEYDAYGRVFGGGGGHEGGAQGFGGFDFSGFQQDFDFGDIFGNIFNGGDRRVNRGRDISIDLEISFKDSIFGTSRHILLNKVSVCSTCQGNGAKPGSKMKKCDLCNGEGKIHENRQTFFGNFAHISECSKCHAKGEIPENKCEKCHGSGVNKGEEEVEINIPPGIESGQMIKLPGLGEAIKNGIPGDLYTKVHVKTHETFRKEGHDLVSDLSVKLTDALLGGKYTIETLEGKIDIKVPSGVEHGHKLRIKGRGVPVSPNKRGDLYVTIDIQIPNKLSNKAKKLVEELKTEGL